MVRQPIGSMQGVSLRFYRPGHVYDLPASLAAYLVTEGFAIVEMRSENNLRTTVDHDRRRRAED
jgi:hypothetical protein